VFSYYSTQVCNFQSPRCHWCC